jgi:radical SAM protein with 4Fe4S-binding SPASM domain
MEQLERAGVRPPRMLTVAITGSCNLECTHCLVESGPRSATRHQPAEAVQRLVAEFAALGGQGVLFTGGEPLSHPRWRDILAAACRQPTFHTVGLQTNGVLLNRARVAALQALDFEGLSLQVSLDGASARTHDAVRGPGTFARTLEALQRLSEAGLGRRVTLAFTEMRHNMEDLPALLDLVHALGLRSLVAGTLVDDGRAAQTGLLPPGPHQYADLLRRYHADARFRSLYREHGRLSAIEWWEGRLGGHVECCTFAEHPYVSAEGRLYPCALCHADDFSAPGAFERPRREALLDAAPRWARLVALRRERHGRLVPCQGCVGERLCAGGCMGRAYAASGDFFAVEDRCELRKAVYGWNA